MAVESPINSNLRTIVDGNTDIFRYGLFKYDESNYEDPTYLGFTIEIDENSALFNEVLPFLEKHSSTRAELNARIPLYNDFKSKIVQIFKSQESVEDPTQKSMYIKQHYINSISGFDNLTKKFNKWREDKLTVELYEDITLFSTYISQLYNNLIYSYENGRAMIPENLLKFNLKIKISEIRNLTSISKLNSNDINDQRIVEGLKNNVTCLVYTLHDCEFDFFNSKPITDAITQAGIDASYSNHSVNNFDIYFKSVSRHVFNPLVYNALSMNDNKIDLGVIIVGSSGTTNPNGQVTDGSETLIGPNGEPYQESQINAISNGNIDGFPARVQKKPSSLSTYISETEKNYNIIDDNDLSEVDSRIQEIKDYNYDLSPIVLGIDGAEFDDLKAPEDQKLMAKIVGKELTNLVKDPQQALNNLTTKVKTKLQNTVKNEIHKAVTLLKQKRNALVKNFIYDLSNNVGLKRIIPDNVYKNQDYYKNILDQLKSDVGLTVGDEIINIITKN